MLKLIRLNQNKQTETKLNYNKSHNEYNNNKN